MGLFEIDDPSIDVEALQAKVEQAIEAKRGVRFTDAELEELRNAELEPRLRRQDLPRGWLDEMPAARSALPPVVPVSQSEAAYRPEDELFATGREGAKGSILRFVRRLARPFYGATINLEWVLARMHARTNEQATKTELSEMTGQLERWRERDLHLLHNLVVEATAMRLQQTHMQDRINELIREVDALKTRERALEALTVEDRSEGPGREV